MKIDLKFGFFDVLGLVFIVLKLCKVIEWSWVWVLCPFWLQIIFIGIVVVKWWSR